MAVKSNSINFAPSVYERNVVSGELALRNRFYEKDPFLSEEGAALVARPGMSYFMSVGTGPIRGIFSQPGSFKGDLFVASGDSVWRVTSNKVATLVVSGLFKPEKGVVKMAAAARIETTPEYLFIADGRNLFCYTEAQNAFGALSGNPVNNGIVQIDQVYYQWTNAAVNLGTPLGTAGSPWRVALGSSAAESLSNLAKAIDGSGVAGTTYNSTVVKHATVRVRSVTTATLTVQAVINGLLGNSIITAQTGGGVTWSGTTLGGAGTSSAFVVPLPGDVGAIDVAVVSSFAIVVPAQGDERNGRFYWIEPGETYIDPLNFATAERSPDPIFGVRVVGDQFWLPGESSTEVWYVSPDSNSPMQRLQGVVFDRGTWEGTAVESHESLIVCDSEGGVFLIQGGSPKRVSTPDIEETIRKAIQLQQSVIIY